MCSLHSIGLSEENLSEFKGFTIDLGNLLASMPRYRNHRRRPYFNPNFWFDRNYASRDDGLRNNVFRVRSYIRPVRQLTIPYTGTVDNDEDIKITLVEPPPSGGARKDNSHENTSSDDVQITAVGLKQRTNKHTRDDAAKDNDQIEMDVNIGTKCPYTKRTMVNPVRNKICGHNYEQREIRHYILHGNNPRCPISGCKNQMRLKLEDLEENKELKAFIDNVKAKRPISHSEVTVASRKNVGKMGISNKEKSYCDWTGHPSKTYNTLRSPISALARPMASKRDSPISSCQVILRSMHPQFSWFEFRRGTEVTKHLYSRVDMFGEHVPIFNNKQDCNANNLDNIRKSPAHLVANKEQWSHDVNSDIYSSSDESEDEWNTIGKTDSEDKDIDDGEESENNVSGYGSEMGDEEAEEHNYFDHQFTDDESGPPDSIQCGCEDCSETSDEDDDTDGEGTEYSISLND